MKKNIMKFIGVAAVTLAAVLVSTTARAQVPTYGYQLVSGVPPYMTNGTVAVTNYPYNNMPILDCRKAQNVGIGYAFSQSGSGTSNQTYVFVRSIDGVNFDTNAADQITITRAGNGGLYPTYFTNISTVGYGYLGLYAITNESLLSVTNNLLEYSIKISAP
jgi:hypothetical protein